MNTQHAMKNEVGYKLYPYGAIEALAPGLWRVVGELQVPMKRTMYIYRLPDGTLLLDSVVAMAEPDLLALEALGRPSVMTIPHPKHLMDAAFYKARYPRLKVYGEPDAQAKIELSFDGTLEQGMPTLGITPHPVPGMKMKEVALELPLEGGSRALLFCDLVNRTNETGSGITGALVKLFGPSGDGGVAPILKLTQIEDKYQVRNFLKRLSALPSIAILAGCHGGVVTHHCAQWLAEAADKL